MASVSPEYMQSTEMEAAADFSPMTQQMVDRPPRVLENSLEKTLCCPSFLACALSTILPCTWCGDSCIQLSERQEAVLLNYGKYQGVLRQPGCYCSNPCGRQVRNVSTAINSFDVPTLKVIDQKGNPINVSGVVTYQVVDSKIAALEVSNYHAYLTTQSEVVLKQVCSMHPYESDKPGEDSLKKEADKVRYQIVSLLQGKAAVAGIRILSFEFRELAYAPEIAAGMLVKQQAEAMLEARKIVVEGAVTIAWDAIHHLQRAGIEIPQPEAVRLASNLVITICSESHVMPTMQLTN